MADDDAGAGQVKQFAIGVQRHGVMRQPARHELLGEGVEGVGRELLPRMGATRLAAGRVAVGRADAEQVPGFFLGTEDRRRVVDLRVHRPGSAAALGRVGHEYVIAGLQQPPEPALAAVGSAFPLRAAHAAAVPQQHRMRMARLGQAVFLHVQLAGAVAAVHVDGARGAVAHHLPAQHRQPAGHGLAAAQEVAAQGFQQNGGVGHRHLQGTP
nr:hypothetical protein [Achromobacter xylosoxidans]